MRQILADLKYIASQNRTLNLVTNFRGIPVNIAAGIVRCSHTTGIVRLQVPDRQIFSLKTAEKILVQSNLFRSMLIGKVDHVELHSAIIAIDSLRYVTGSMGNRKNLRVQPESPIHVEIIMGHGYSAQGKVIDISQDGLSIQMAKEDFPEDNLFILQIPVEIRFGLTISGNVAVHDISVQAMIAYANESQQTYRVGLLTFLKEPELRLLRRYVFDRQTEILNEIQQMNSAMLDAIQMQIY